MSRWEVLLQNKFHAFDSVSLKALDHYLTSFEAAMDANKPADISDEGYRLKVQRAVQHTLHNLVQPETENSKVCYRLEARDLDFTMGDNVYSTTPRLLLKVPVARENIGAGPVTVKAVAHRISIDTSSVKTTDKTVLIVPNQEGAEEDLADRPVVQYSAVGAGEYVILGGLKLENRQAVYDVVASVVNPPEGRNAFSYLDESGTVEDLAKIIQGIQKLGFGNFYNTDDKYRTNNVQPLPSTEGAAIEKGFSGFYEKPANAILNSAVFLSGPVLFIGRGRSEEFLPENGYALFEKVVNQSDFNVKPISPPYMAKNFVHRQSRMSVSEKAPEGQAVLMFAADHPLRDFTREFANFQQDMVAFNRGTRPQIVAKPGFNNAKSA